MLDNGGGAVHETFARGLVAAALLSLTTGGCASSEKALDLIGLQSKPAVPDVSTADLQGKVKVAQKVTLRVHAGDVLNTNASGQSLALVAKVYFLKDPEAFLRAPYEVFQEASAGKSSAVQGVLEVREIVLAPGQRYEAIETLPLDATHLAVVGLFRAPDDRRWRFVFEAKAAAKTGITIGAHGCALSVSEGQPVNSPAETLRLAGVRCQ